VKTYEVVFDPDAQREALEAADYIAQTSPHNAEKWFAGLQVAVEGLRRMPKRYGKARESEALGIDLRQHVYHSHRMIFRVEEDAGTVRVLHIRHAARRAIGEVD